MVLSSLSRDASLVEFLESQARNESTKELVARTIVAFALVTTTIGLVTWGKPIIGTFSVAYFSYAVWGMLDRARSYSVMSNRGRTAEYLRILCAFFVGLGVVSGIAALFAIGFTLLGSSWVL